MSQPEIRFKSDRIDAYLREHLAPDENVLWVAEKCRATAEMKTLYALHLIFVLFGWSMIALTPISQTFLAMWQSLSLFSVIALMIAIVWLLESTVSIWCILRTNRFAYAVTDRRLIILNDFFPHTIRSVPPDEIEYVAVQTIDGNKGSIFLRPFGIIFHDMPRLLRRLMPRKIMNASDIHTAVKHLNALLAQKQKNVAKQEQLAQSEQGETSKPPDTGEEKAARQGLFRTWG
ncbi:MAG TPA: hypothetical protein DDZ43_14140 [Hyphomonadaceae bacterium]|nr:hypothetical protein [Ponticaulis sp.]RPG18283.1 MAG: hypothetical protein CBC85_003375 [Hyphomonadaceae bacterium TMED125]HBH88901.1 hypothetical protein [Hyphomonadaceae bacterium]HBJ94016.1 hypothetical protein [Hyphomonadaceae bacterium]